MYRSFDLVAANFCSRRPELRRFFSNHRTYMLCWLLNGALKAGDLRKAIELACELLRAPSINLPAAILMAASRTVRGMSRRWLLYGGRRQPLPWAPSFDVSLNQRPA
jgi:hypothetical protein